MALPAGRTAALAQGRAHVEEHRWAGWLVRLRRAPIVQTSEISLSDYSHGAWKRELVPTRPPLRFMLGRAPRRQFDARRGKTRVEERKDANARQAAPCKRRSITPPSSSSSEVLRPKAAFENSSATASTSTSAEAAATVESPTAASATVVAKIAASPAAGVSSAVSEKPITIVNDSKTVVVQIITITPVLLREEIVGTFYPYGG